MTMLEQAKFLHSLGYSVIPVGKDKKPIGSWSKSILELVEPTDAFSRCEGIGLVCGAVSGDVEVIDIDEKYSLDGKLFESYKKSIADIDKNLLRKLVVEKTPSGGYHFVYKFKTTDGNKKLANRHTTDEEKALNPKEKVKVLIETRNNGGYVKIYPSPNYELLYGDFSKIQYITQEERDVLFSCAIGFNSYFNDVEKPIYKQKTNTQGLSPFDDYNQRGDVLSLLESEGWSIAKQNSKNFFLKRPGATDSPHSATLHKETSVFYVFSTSTEFESCKGYSPASVYCLLKHNNNFSDAARSLLSLGYGEKTEYPKKETKTYKSEKFEEPDDFSFLASKTKISNYIKSVKDGTLPMGLSTGFSILDAHMRFKRGNFNVIGGHDNVGKTFVIMFLLVQSAKLHGWKWFVVSTENSAGSLMKMLIEFYSGRPILGMNDKEVLEATTFIDNHFDIVDNEESYTFLDILKMSEKMHQLKKIDGVFIDPYNAVEFDEVLLKLYGDHNYHYKVTTEFRKFCKKHDCCIYLNCHAVTEALRRVWSKDLAPEGELVGHPMPPKKSDVEGGGKFGNRADDFWIIHRYTQHKMFYRVTEIHVVKTKETDTGGRNTLLNDPIKMELKQSNCGFKPFGAISDEEFEPIDDIPF